MDQKIMPDHIWQAYRNKLFAFIRTRVDSVEDAEDILSDVFVTLVAVSNNKELPDHLGAWLYRVTRNRIVDFYRSKVSLDPLPENLVEEHEEPTAIKSISMCMLPMIQDLPEKYQLPLILSEIEGKRNKDVATELDLSLPAVKSRILRGRKMLYGSILACCDISRSHTGSVIDFEKKPGSSCDDCGHSVNE